jgi:hypothetical protein
VKSRERAGDHHLRPFLFELPQLQGAPFLAVLR